MEEAKKFCAERENYEVETSRDGLDDELEKGLDPRISITEAHKTNEKEREFRSGSVDSPDSGPLAFLGLQRKDSKDEERINVEIEGEENENESDKKEDKAMETEQADDLDEEKHSGQILFGTLFNYMKDSKDPEEASELSSADQKSKHAGSEDNENKGMDVNAPKMLEDISEEQNNHQD